MKRTFKGLVADGLIFFVGIWVFCATLAAPGLSAASAKPGCTQNSSALGKAGCENSGFLCAFGPIFNGLSKGTLASTRIQDFPKDTEFPITGVVPIGSSDGISLANSGLSAASLSFPTQKVSIYLFNSVLTL